MMMVIGYVVVGLLGAVGIFHAGVWVGGWLMIGVMAEFGAQKELEYEQAMRQMAAEPEGKMPN